MKYSLLALPLYTILLMSTFAHAAEVSNSDWPMFGRDLNNQRFSPLKIINRQNVSHLSLAWEHKSGIKGSLQTTPVVVNGVMYVSLPYNHVVALDAKTGKELWRYKHTMRPDWKMCCGPANRGVAVSDGKVFIGTVDARLIALEATTGKVIWDIDAVEENVKTEGIDTLQSGDPLSKGKISGGTGIGIAMAPVVYKGRVIVGITGVGYGLHIDAPREDAPLGAVIGVAGRYGRPGFLAAFDVNTGKRVWQFDTIPETGWEGQFSATTPDGIPLNRDLDKERVDFKTHQDAWRYGGGSAWTVPAIDTATGLLYFGTGNPSPQMDDLSRPGDNLYTVSLVALNAETGKMQWHYQQVPHDVWGYDLASPPVLFNWQDHGKSIPAVGQASKTGWFYVHDRATGKLLIKSDAFVPQSNLFVHATKEGVRVHPGVLGGSNWSPTSLDELHQRVFIAGLHMPIRYTLHEEPAREGVAAIRYVASEPIDEPRWGLLSSVDLETGHIAWQVKTPEPLVGGVLATNGGLVFTGEGNGIFDAFNSDTGDKLWQYQASAGVNAPPITYTLDGEQYIAVAAGGNAIFGYKQGDSLLVFKLK